jgi:hypothetical protein
MRAMLAEGATTQLRLVDLPLHLPDQRLHVDHAFPFVDRHWRIAFHLLDLYLAGPRVLRDPLEFRPGGLFCRSDSRALLFLGAVPREELAGLVHFDPWWVFRNPTFAVPSPYAPFAGAGLPDPGWIEAVKATNIAVRFAHEGRRYAVHDLEFDPGLRRMDALVARGPLGRRVAFHYGEIDLMELRRPAPRA